MLDIGSTVRYILKNAEYCEVLDFEALLRFRWFWVLESNAIHPCILQKYIKDMPFVH